MLKLSPHGSDVFPKVLKLSFEGSECKPLALGMSLVAVFVISLVFISHPGTCVIVTVLIGLVEVELYGLLAWAGLKLNAVVMVNLIMSMGIAVEFLSHIARAFMMEQGTRQGLTHVHFSAQLKRCLWYRGCMEGVVRGCLRGVRGW